MASVSVKVSPKAAKILGDKLDIITVREALKVQELAKVNCPVDTGTLRDSIRLVRDGTSVRVGTDVGYGLYIEVGTDRITPVAYLRRAMTQVVSEDRQIKK